MKFNLITALFLSLYSFSFAAWAAADPLLGTWKTIDDRTGYSLSDVVISKDQLEKLVNEDLPDALENLNV